MNWRTTLSLAAFSGFIFVALGAFGAHGLSKMLDAKQMYWLQTGLEYQGLHTAVLLAVGVLLIRYNQFWLRLSALLLTIGVVLFSGSLYVLAIFAIKIWPYITPMGGFFLLFGWLALLVGVLTLKGKSSE